MKDAIEKSRKNQIDRKIKESNEKKIGRDRVRRILEIEKWRIGNCWVAGERRGKVKKGWTN